MRRLKLKNILHKASNSVADGLIMYSQHANERMLERGVAKPEVEFVLKNGHHEADLDQ